jgi:DNA-binding transcriptional ArsR family regulator
MGETRLYGGSWDLKIKDKKRLIDERYVPSEKWMRKSNALTPYAIIDQVLKTIPAEKRRSILMWTLELSKEYPDELAEHVNLLNASLCKFGYILLTPEDCKGRNGYNEIDMVITGVARRSVEQNVNANSTKAVEGFHTYIPKYITVSDKALLHDKHDNMFQTCISVREGIAEFEWTLTGDTLGKMAKI